MRSGGYFVPNKWSGRRDSNPRPSAWEADALPLSYTRIGSYYVGMGLLSTNLDIGVQCPFNQAHNVYT